MSRQKFLSLDAIAAQALVLKGQGKRVVLCHGTFDLMHAGHIRYLQRAREEGDVLLVTVTADEFVNKGPGRPVFGEQIRAENLAALECVDFVAINRAVSAVEALQRIQPHVYAKGSEYRSHDDDVTGNIAREQAAVEAHGGEMFYTDEITFSSSSLLNQHFDVFAPETRDFLERFGRKWPVKEIHRIVESLAGLKVLVIGDAIVDQYHYVSPLGQTGKGNALAVRYESEEQFAGGSLAVANHVARFAESVTVVAALGDIDSHEEFIRSKLHANVTPVFSRFQGAPTVTKRRFVDNDLSKLFEVYFFQESPSLQQDGRDVCAWLEEHAADFDVVVAADFGNGFISDSMIRVLCDKARFIAVNTQINSGNRGYHAINRYPRADFVSLNEPELRLAAHNRHGTLEDVGQLVGGKVMARHLAITRGVRGVMMLDLGAGEVHRIPALSSRVIDRVGAGDAFLSLAALCLGKGVAADAAAFIGSVAAAMDVQIVCNRDSIDPIALKKYVATLLK